MTTPFLIYGSYGYIGLLVGTLGVVKRVLEGDLEAGFQTPARVNGKDFILEFEGVRREDIKLE